MSHEKCKMWTSQKRLSVEKEKLPTVIVGLFSLREKSPTKTEGKYEIPNAMAAQILQRN